MVDAAEVVVVGDPVPTHRPVTFTREDPRHGGPVAALLTGRDALLDAARHGRRAGRATCPASPAQTFRRLRDAARGHDGAFLAGPDGRRQLAGVLDVARLDAVRPGLEDQHGLALHRLLAGARPRRGRRRGRRAPRRRHLGGRPGPARRDHSIPRRVRACEARPGRGSLRP